MGIRSDGKSIFGFPSHRVMEYQSGVQNSIEAMVDDKEIFTFARLIIKCTNIIKSFDASVLLYLYYM